MPSHRPACASSITPEASAYRPRGRRAGGCRRRERRDRCPLQRDPQGVAVPSRSRCNYEWPGALHRAPVRPRQPGVPASAAPRAGQAASLRGSTTPTSPPSASGAITTSLRLCNDDAPWSWWHPSVGGAWGEQVKNDLAGADAVAAPAELEHDRHAFVVALAAALPGPDWLRGVHASRHPVRARADHGAAGAEPPASA